jgi:hypothetical protein
MLSGGITTGQLLTAEFAAQSGYGWIIATGITLAVAGLLALLGALRIHSTALPAI